MGFQVISLLPPLSFRISDGPVPVVVIVGIGSEGADGCHLEASETRRDCVTVLPDVVLIAVAVDAVQVVE